MDATTAQTPKRLLRALVTAGLLAAGWLAIDLVVNAESAAADTPDLPLIQPVDDAVTTVVSEIAEPVDTATAPVVATAIETMGGVVDVVVETADHVVPGILPPLHELVPGVAPDLLPALEPLLGQTTTPTISGRLAALIESAVAAVEPAPSVPFGHRNSAPGGPPEAPAPFSSPGADLEFGIPLHFRGTLTAPSASERAPAPPTFDSDTTPD